MSCFFIFKVIIVNCFLEGDVVWLIVDNQWMLLMVEVELVEDEVYVDLCLLEVQKMVDVIVGVYLVDVKVGENGFEFIYFCEEFCICGLLNYVYGKQVEEV